MTQRHTFASYALLFQTLFSQAAPLLPSVAQQQNVMEYWWQSSASIVTTTTIWNIPPNVSKALLH